MRIKTTLAVTTSVCLFICPVFCQKQNTDTLISADLQPVVISAYRLEQPDLKTPVAVTTIGKFRLQSGKQQLALDESLAAVPGVFVQNGDNFSQDVRVSIRGFGARSAFGIRGIKILLDGFPETSPDGQGQVDNIDPGAITSISVIRGASSGLYGNSSGGAIHIHSLEFGGRGFVEASANAGSFGFQKFQLKTGGGLGKFQYNLSSAYTKTDGYREYSAMKNYLLNGGIKVPLDSSSYFLLALNYTNSPLAQDPGGITLQQATENPASARDRNVLFDASEKVQQGRAGLAFVKQTSASSKITARAYISARVFSNKLPFENGGIVEFDRLSMGSSFDYSKTGKLFGLPWQARAGVEAENQSDDRRRFNNLQGVKKDLNLEQEEIFSSIGLYMVHNLMISKRLAFSPGLRFDAVKLEAKDHYLADGDNSSKRTLNSVNPIFGLVYSPSPETNIYANAATNFETPTLSELSSNPNGGGGFNEGLVPQKAVSYELGVKGFLEKSRLRYDVALFHIRLKDEFRPYELPDFPSRVFYQNAGASKRSGLEVGLGNYLGRGFYLYLNYTLSAFIFTDHQTASANFNDNHLPGIPRHIGYAELRYFKTEGFYGVFQSRFIGKQFADDANSVETDSYWLSNLRFGYNLKSENWQGGPFFGINNLLGSSYFSNLRINAAGNRFYEPAAGLHFFAGFKIRFAKSG